MLDQGGKHKALGPKLAYTEEECGDSENSKKAHIRLAGWRVSLPTFSQGRVGGHGGNCTWKAREGMKNIAVREREGTVLF